MSSRIYTTRIKQLPGTRWADVARSAAVVYSQIRRRTKRRPYIRSAYFQKQKVFLELFWRHLYEKQNLRDKTRRVKYFSCALDLIRHSRCEPVSKQNPNRRAEIVHRFAGQTTNGEQFFVQIKEVKRSGEKWLMSVFPAEK